MAAFRYSAFTAAGKAKKGVIIADTERHAAELLKADGLFASEITAKAERAARGWKRARVSDEARMVFTRQMAVLLGADLPTDAALEAVQNAVGQGGVEAFAADAKAAVLEGQPLSDALAGADPSLPAFYIAAIRAGEGSGDLPLVFEKLASYLEEARTDRSALTSALIYPGFVAAVSILVCGILMTSVAPEIAAMFEISGRELPQLTQVMMGISNWIQTHWAVVLGFLILKPILFILALRIPAFRDRWHGFLLRLPLVGRMIRHGAAAQYLRTLSLIIASRQTLVNAAKCAADVTTITRFRAEAERATAAIENGQSLSTALQSVSIIPPVARQLIDIGETSSDLTKMSERAAQMVENTLTTERKRLASLIDPMLMIVVGGMVLVIVLSVLLPIFDLQSLVGG